MKSFFSPLLLAGICCLQVSAGQSTFSAGVDTEIIALADESGDDVSVTGYLRLEGPRYLQSLSSGGSSSSGRGGSLEVAGSHWDVADNMGRYASIGSVSVGMGALAYFGTMAAVGAWGTASTGVAISALSGVAASNASLAFLGGGAIAAGGGGIALGSAILTGGIGVVVIGAGAGVVYLWRLGDHKKELDNLGRKVELLDDATILDLILANDLQYPFYGVAVAPESASSTGLKGDCSKIRWSDGTYEIRQTAYGAYEVYYNGTSVGFSSINKDDCARWIKGRK